MSATRGPGAALRWIAGPPHLREPLARCIDDAFSPDARAALVRENSRRRLLRIRLAASAGAPPQTLMLKHFRAASGPHPIRDRIKAATPLAPARREWRALRTLYDAGVTVPEPLALATLPNGEGLLVTRFVNGTNLVEALRAAGPERRGLLRALGELVARMHAAGLVHRDLHGGNVLVGAPGPVLLDLQHARASRSRRARLRDVGSLDYSLSQALTMADRIRLRAAALGLARPFGLRARRRLRAVGRACRTRARRHASSRTRRALRPGRRFARLRIGGLRGMRVREIASAEVAALLGAHERALRTGDASVLKHDGRSRITAVDHAGRRAVVKEVVAGGLARHLADAVRGSPARRAWLGGHGLRARDIAAALPLAFLERRRLGVPVASVVVLEDLRPAVFADRLAERTRESARLLDTLVDLLLRLHRRHAVHGDLKASHIAVSCEGADWIPRPLDLEGVRFPRRLSEAERILALAQLNASLPDAVPARERHRAFLRYARALPFRNGSDAALRQVVARSLDRAHRWSGADCALAGRLGGNGEAGQARTSSQR